MEPFAASRRRVAGLRFALVLTVTLWAPAAAAQQCLVLWATPMVFTGYSPFGAGVTATSTVYYWCNNPNGAQPWIGISTPRTMTFGGSSLTFDVYQDPPPSGTVWPSAPPVLVPPPGGPLGIGSVPVYGFLPANQDVPAGSYQTTLTVSMYTGGGGKNFANSASLTVRTDMFVATCIIDPATLAFGSYDPLGGPPRDAQTSIQIQCTQDTAYTVALGPGDNPGATRQMANGAQRLAYELYSDPGRTTPWTTTATVGSTAPSIAPILLPVYGRIPAGQLVGAGDYSDTVQSTVNF